MVSVVVCLVAAEGAIRIIDGMSPAALVLPEMISSQGVDTTAGHLDKMPRAAGVEREWFFTDPPPLPNRTRPPQEWVDLDRQIQREPVFGANASGNPFLPWDMFKAWNSVFVGDPCKHSYLSGAPGRLFVYDPPDGKPRPTFRFLPNATVPDGLVTNAFGWRGPPVPFARSPKTVRIVFVGASTVAEIHPYPFSGPEYIDNWLNRWATARRLDVRFEVLNAGRESINSTDIAAIVREEVVPLRPDLVVYYEGGNQLQLGTVVKNVPKGVPLPDGKIARWLREAASYSALARRAEGLTVGSEWSKPSYELTWPEGLDEFDPDITRPDLPVNLNTIIADLESIRSDLAKVGGELSVASFHWLAKEGLVLDAVHQKPILETLNVRYFPFRYRDLERLTTFENRVFAKYDAVHGLPFIDVAGHMPYDPNLFSDAIHNTPAGVRLRAWIELQQLVPIIEKHLASGAWPKPPSATAGDLPPIFAIPPRQITFNCKSP
jgi:hypothetical protein